MVSLPSRKETKSIRLSFVDFFEEDNGLDPSKSSSSEQSVTILHHVNTQLRLMLDELSLQQLHTQFLQNEEFRSFFSSYLTHRSRPHEVALAASPRGHTDDGNTSQEQQQLLQSLDQHIFLLTLRAVTPLPQADGGYSPPLQLMQQQLCNAKEGGVLSISNLACLFAVAGDSNVEMSRAVIANLVDITSPGFVATQVASFIDECAAHVSSINNNINNNNSSSSSSSNGETEGVRKALKAVSLKRRPSAQQGQQGEWEQHSKLLRGAAVAASKSKSKSKGEGEGEGKGKDKRERGKTNRVDDGDDDDGGAGTETAAAAAASWARSALDLVLSLYAVLAACSPHPSTAGGSHCPPDAPAATANSDLTASSSSSSSSVLGLALLLRDGKGLNRTGVTLLLDICGTLYDTVAPAIERAAASASHAPTVAAMRQRLIQCALVLCDGSYCQQQGGNHNPQYPHTGGNNNPQQQEGAAGGSTWMEVLLGQVQVVSTAPASSSSSDGMPPPPLLAQEMWWANSSSSSSSSSTIQLHHMQRHLLAAGEDAEQVAYLFACLQAARAEQQHYSSINSNGVETPKSAAAMISSAILPPPPPPAAATAAEGADSSSSSSSTANARGTQHTKEALGAISALQGMFPDLGEGYCYACLDAFDWQVDRTVDAILTNNLPLALATLDRATRNRLDLATEAMKRTERQQQEQIQAQEAHEREKSRLRAVLAREEADQHLLRRHAAEYADEYDDQWDDAPVAMPGSAAARAAVVTGSRQQGSGSGSTATGESDADRKKRLRREKAQQSKAAVALEKARRERESAEQEEVVRVNALIRERKEEEAYWAELANGSKASNARRGARQQQQQQDGEEEEEGGGEEDEEGERGAGSSSSRMPSHKPAAAATASRGGGGGGGNGSFPPRGKQQQQQQQQQQQGKKKETNGAGASAAGDGSSSSSNSGSTSTAKPRTKTFDKHRQKSKALKRGDTFKG